MKALHGNVQCDHRRQSANPDGVQGAAEPLPHFNEADECAGLDAVITKRVLRATDVDPVPTLHDVRWGEE
jgi:hypothetical protein